MSDITPDTDSVKELCLKINALAERGSTEGERQAAKNKLEEILLLYGLEMSDIDDAVQKVRAFPYKSKDSKVVLSHCIWDVDNDAEIRENGKRFFVLLNAPQYIEVKEKYTHYWKQYKVEKERFMTAFVIKNSLGLSESSDGNKLSEEDVARMQVLTMAMEDNPFEKDAPTKLIGKI